MELVKGVRSREPVSHTIFSEVRIWHGEKRYLERLSPQIALGFLLVSRREGGGQLKKETVGGDVGGVRLALVFILGLRKGARGQASEASNTLT